MEDSGQYDARKFRKGSLSVSGTWVTIIALGTGIVATWATNANRLTNLEQQEAESKIEREKMEIHISSDDQQIAVLKERLQFIIEQLGMVNLKLDRAEEERRK